MSKLDIDTNAYAEAAYAYAAALDAYAHAMCARNMPDVVHWAVAERRRAMRVADRIARQSQLYLTRKA